MRGMLTLNLLFLVQSIAIARPTIAHTALQQTGALRDFDPGHVRFGSQPDEATLRAMSAYPPKADMRRGRDVACASLLDPCGPRGRPSDRGVLRAGDWHLRSRIISTWSSAGWLWLAAMNLQKGYRDSPRPLVRARSRRITGGGDLEKNRRVYKPRPVGERGPSTPSTGRAGKSLPWLR